MITDRVLRAARILVVDDEQPNLDLLAAVLTRDGYTNFECVGDSRLVAERYASLQPDLVVLDLGMPHLDGFAVLAQLRALEPDGLLTVLVMTGRTDRETRLRALASGARDFLGKPFDVTEVLVRIRNMIEARLLHRRVTDDNLALEAVVRERTRELRETQLEVVHRLAQAAERRDRETGSHIIRMSRYAAQVAAAHGWASADVELMLQASPLHDIGKIAIPDAILLKPGALTPEEWTIMRSHTVIGMELLEGGTSRLVQTGRIIARSHHERWDGSGYPDGLAGPAIPEAARICAVADVFDALTSDRCYHAAVGVDQGAEIIRTGAGTHFDPAVVASFERALPAIIEIRSAVGTAG